MMYDNVDDARVKLQATLIYYDNKAWWCEEVSNENGPIELKLRLPGKNDRTTVVLGDAKLRYMQYQIGYVNYRGNAQWFYRLPVRQYRQGLKGDSMGSRDESPFSARNQGIDDRIRFNDHARMTDCFANMMENNYPSFKEAISKLTDGTSNKVAFHQNFAVYKDKFRKDYVIEYKGKAIAFTRDLDHCETSDDYKFLREVIQKAGIKVK